MHITNTCTYKMRRCARGRVLSFHQSSFHHRGLGSLMTCHIFITSLFLNSIVQCSYFSPPLHSFSTLSPPLLHSTDSLTMHLIALSFAHRTNRRLFTKALSLSLSLSVSLSLSHTRTLSHSLSVPLYHTHIGLQ